MRTLLLITALFGCSVCAFSSELRLGIVGTDTSHVIAFTNMLNDPAAKGHMEGVRVVAAYKGGSPDVEYSRSRVDGIASQLEDKFKIRMAASIPELCSLVDAVLLESVDGRVHLKEAREIIVAKKPLFINKPLASTLEDAREISRLAKEAGVPWFSASSLRFGGVALIKRGVEGAETCARGGSGEILSDWHSASPELRNAGDVRFPGCRATEQGIRRQTRRPQVIRR